ncbi:hypothetical protein [Nocardia macrotermitis]|uniref:Uncharacterized protein n=1 Tax=Nocardia macrotermitis TaxID=2585198 RepID=A0A7K0D3X3_9NOCA|nr:hypothetical protein [Nocardia macrotermitis]MQY20435.1 hypothetical protein [Nocardia macrotermitis]
MHPPSDPPLPGDRARYGSKTGILDKSEAAANSAEAAAAQAFFDSMGWDFSSDLLGYYLGNNGPDHEYTISQANMEIVVGTSEVQGKVSGCLDWIRNEAKRDPQIDVLRDISTGWVGAGPTENADVAHGIGHFAVAVGSDTRVKKSADGSGLVAEIWYNVYVYDYYNFDDKPIDGYNPWDDFQLGVNNDMRQLEEAGWARSFKARGDILKFWSGAL